MHGLSSLFASAAELVGLLLAAVIALKAYRHLFFARVGVEFLPPSSESYVQTPDSIDEKDVTNLGSRQLSFSKFRLSLRLSTSHKILLRGANLYAFHRDMARQWAELSPITLPVSSRAQEIQASIQDFVESNSKDNVSKAIILDNGTENYKIELSAGEDREMVIARLGGFILPLPERSRTIKQINFCDVLVRLNINTVAVAFLVCVPRYSTHDDSGPIISDFKIFGRAKTIDVLTWATKVRPDPGAEGGRRAEKFWVKLHK